MPLVCPAEAEVWPRPILAALRQWPGCVWAYRLGPCGPNDAINLSDVHMYQAEAQFYQRPILAALRQPP